MFSENISGLGPLANDEGPNDAQRALDAAAAAQGLQFEDRDRHVLTNGVPNEARALTVRIVSFHALLTLEVGPVTLQHIGHETRKTLRVVQGEEVHEEAEHPSQVTFQRDFATIADALDFLATR